MQNSVGIHDGRVYKNNTFLHNAWYVTGFFIRTYVIRPLKGPPLSTHRFLER